MDSGRDRLMQTTDIRIKEVSFAFEDFRYRAPIKFGGIAFDRVTLVNVNCIVEAGGGKVARGFGSMPLGNVWSFPSRPLSYDQTLNAMKLLVERIAQITRGCNETGHPIDLTLGMEPAYLQAADEVSASLKLPEKIPTLCTLVCASAFDAALHDGY